MNNKYKDWLRNQNYELIQKYPWIAPWNNWTQEKPETYDYEYTLLDNLPVGWVATFGYDLLEEVNKVLVDENMVKDYLLLNIKEEDGNLIWYGSYYSPKLDAVLDGDLDEIIDALITFNQAEMLASQGDA